MSEAGDKDDASSQRSGSTGGGNSETSSQRSDSKFLKRCVTRQSVPSRALLRPSRMWKPESRTSPSAVARFLRREQAGSDADESELAQKRSAQEGVFAW